MNNLLEVFECPSLGPFYSGKERTTFLSSVTTFLYVLDLLLFQALVLRFSQLFHPLFPSSVLFYVHTISLKEFDHMTIGDHVMDDHVMDDHVM